MISRRSHILRLHTMTMLITLTALFAAVISCSLSDPLDPANAAAFIEAPSIVRTYTSSVDISFRLTGSAELFYAAVASGSPAPSYNDLVNGIPGTGGIVSRTSYLVNKDSITGGVALPGGGTFDIHIAARSVSGHTVLFSKIHKLTATASGSLPQMVLEWGGSGSGDGKFGSPYAVTVDSAQNIYITDTTEHCVQKFSANGTFLLRWGGYGNGNGKFDWPVGIAAYGGYIYVVDSVNQRVQKFTENGAYVSQWGSAGSLPGQFLDPQDITADGSGNIYTVDNGNSRIQKFSPEGTFIRAWGSSGSADGEFDDVWAIAVNDSGIIIVHDDGNDRVQRFTADGEFLSALPIINTAGKIALDAGGNIFVSAYIPNLVYKYSPSGTPIQSWPVTSPEGIAVNAFGAVIVVVHSLDWIQVYR